MWEEIRVRTGLRSCQAGAQQCCALHDRGKKQNWCPRRRTGACAWRSGFAMRGGQKKSWVYTPHVFRKSGEDIAIVRVSLVSENGNAQTSATKGVAATLLRHSVEAKK